MPSNSFDELLVEPPRSRGGAGIRTGPRFRRPSGHAGSNPAGCTHRTHAAHGTLRGTCGTVAKWDTRRTQTPGGQSAHAGSTPAGPTHAMRRVRAHLLYPPLRDRGGTADAARSNRVGPWPVRVRLPPIPHLTPPRFAALLDPSRRAGHVVCRSAPSPVRTTARARSPCPAPSTRTAGASAPRRQKTTTHPSGARVDLGDRREARRPFGRDVVRPRRGPCNCLPRRGRPEPLGLRTRSCSRRWRATAGGHRVGQRPWPRAGRSRGDVGDPAGIAGGAEARKEIAAYFGAALRLLPQR